MDIDRDGFITTTELQEYLKNLKIPFTDQEVDEMVEEADINNDGNLFENFCLS